MPDLTIISIVVGAAVLLTVLFLLLRWRKGSIDKEVRLPWTLLVAFREMDQRAKAGVDRIRNRLLTKLDRDYTLQSSSLFQLVADTINQTGERVLSG
jgi:hypothetical protein